MAEQAGRGCSVEGCPRPHKARGLCPTHYRAWWRAERDANPSIRRCSVPACHRSVDTRGLCLSHYRRVLREERDADPSAPRCQHPGCPRADHAKGYCHSHYSSALRAGVIGDPCAVPGCPSGVAARGMCHRHAKRARVYGLTAAELTAFEGDCEVCGRPAEAVDHDHTTGAVRGALCFACNSALGQAQDDPARLRALADYLDKHSSKEHAA